MKKQDVINKIRGGLIVSCQARPGWPMYGPDIMASFAKAAELGGAVAIRATGKENIREIKKQVNLPVLGINKIFDNNYDVYITPTFASAVEILEEGIDIIAIDATERTRPNGEKFTNIVRKIKENYPEVLIMAEISTLEEALIIKDEPIDFISTTLSGYTESSKLNDKFNPELIKEIKQNLSIPIVAEGRIETPEEAKTALKAGAHSVVVGTSITRPEVITKRFVSAIEEGDLLDG